MFTDIDMYDEENKQYRVEETKLKMNRVEQNNIQYKRIDHKSRIEQMDYVLE